MIEYKNELNEEQFEAVTHCEGPLLVLAGAGTGKTRVITYRIAYLIDKINVEPYRILSVTFTNKAAEEMKFRLFNLIGSVSKTVWAGTFHSIALRILRRDGAYIGLKEGFSVVDQDDRISILRSILKELGIDTKKYTPKMYLSKISDYKNTLEFVKEIAISDETLLNFEKVFDAYQQRMSDSNMIDFDDMLSLSIRLFMKNKDVADKYKNLFEHILVDEYQDTNLIQFVFLNILSGNKGNICVVGDDDQSIYGWRGAEIKNILEFDSVYEQVKIIKLIQNYRSDAKIIFTANSLISCNRYRRDKQLKPVSSEPGFVKLTEYYDGQNEADTIAKEILNLINLGIEHDEIAILYRTNAQSRSFEVVLNHLLIPYKVIGGIGFYQRKEIKDILSYLRVFNNKYDVQAFERSLKVPPKGIGQASVNKIINFASNNAMDLLEASKEISNSMSSKQKNSLLNYLNLFEELKTSSSISEMIIKIVEMISYEDFVKKYDDERDAKIRMENIEELINAATEFEENNEEGSLSDFLASTTLQTSSDEPSEKTVKLMTIHAAKGLEFHSVFLTGLEDGLFPLFRAYEDDTGMELEEERRLCYVGITRAKKRLYLSYAASRMVYGKWQNSRKSIFLHEMNIPDNKNKFSTGRKVIKSIKEDENELKDGSKVFHNKFGEGLVVGISGSGENAKVDVYFKTRGLKKVVASFLQKI
jgi:DNA helicase-2/ATP-dependent DNA helicase PcrA